MKKIPMNERIIELAVTATKYVHHIHCFVLGVFVGVTIIFFTVTK